MKDNDASTQANTPPQETELYSSIQNDMFYTAMGVMAAQSVNVKETAPKTGKNEAILYIASATATTEALARSQLKSALNTANTDAIALNLPALAPGNNVRAFNALDDVKASNTTPSKKFILLGGFLGLILGSLFVISRFLIQQHQHARRT